MTDASRDAWPALPLDEWRDSCATLHMWTQVVGKVRLALSPPINHWWHVALYVTARGLTTSPMPHGPRTFQIDFDFIDHVLRIEASDGAARAFPLAPYPVSGFYHKLMDALDALDLGVRILPRPVEVVEAIPFEEDDVHAAYDPDYANRFWRILASSARVMREFRGGFLGKASPVHFFWGSFDQAVTLFSGRAAPPHPGGFPNLADRVAREAYSRECSSAGFWPGNGAPAIDAPAFYAYAYPEPPGYPDHPVRPGEAFYSPDMREFVLPYEAVRTAADPAATLRAFLDSTYEAAAERGGWDRPALERRTAG